MEQRDRLGWTVVPHEVDDGMGGCSTVRDVLGSPARVQMKSGVWWVARMRAEG